MQRGRALEQLPPGVSRPDHVDQFVVDFAQPRPPGPVLVVERPELRRAPDIRVVASVAPAGVRLQDVAALYAVVRGVLVRKAGIGPAIDMGEGHGFRAVAQDAVGQAEAHVPFRVARPRREEGLHQGPLGAPEAFGQAVALARRLDDAGPVEHRLRAPEPRIRQQRAQALVVDRRQVIELQSDMPARRPQLVDDLRQHVHGRGDELLVGADVGDPAFLPREALLHPAEDEDRLAHPVPDDQRQPVADIDLRRDEHVAGVKDVLRRGGDDEVELARLDKPLQPGQIAERILEAFRHRPPPEDRTERGP